MDRIQLRRDSSARWAEINPILLEGEVGYEIDTKLRKIGDGVNRWNDLEYLRAEGISQEIGNSQNITMSQDAITRELSELGSEVDDVNLNMFGLHAIIPLIKNTEHSSTKDAISVRANKGETLTIQTKENSVLTDYVQIYAYISEEVKEPIGFVKMNNDKLSVVLEKDIIKIGVYVPAENIPDSANVELNIYKSSTFSNQVKKEFDKINPTVEFFTDNNTVNKVIRKLFVDLGSKSFTGLNLTLARNVGGLWGIVIYEENRNVVFDNWMSHEGAVFSGTFNGVYVYAEYDWSKMNEGASIGNCYLIDAFNKANDPRGKITSENISNNAINTQKIEDLSILTSKIADNAIILQKLDDNLKHSLAVPTTNVKMNEVLKRIYVDEQEYIGSKSLEGLKIRALARDVDGLWGVRISNDTEDLFTGWLNNEEKSQTINIDGLYIYIEYDWSKMAIGDVYYNGLFTTFIRNAFKNREEQIIINSLTNCYYGQVGDSISEGVGLSDNLSINDHYNPIAGSKKATYGYYIAKNNRMAGWYNYGKSGTTLGDVNVGNEDRNGFSKENGRYTQMADSLDYISIFFGWNDAEYGPRMRKQMWIQETYGNNHLYPARNDNSYIGTNGYCTQEEYDAVNAMTGVVNGITYNNSSEYWNAVYVGTPNDNTNKTWWGAFNIVLPYLINKYPLAKILLISPYPVLGSLFVNATKDAAKKYGLAFYDWDEHQLFEYRTGANGVVNGVNVGLFRRNNLTYDGLHPNKQGYKYMYSSICQALLNS